MWWLDSGGRPEAIRQERPGFPDTRTATKLETAPETAILQLIAPDASAPPGVAPVAGP